MFGRRKLNGSLGEEGYHYFSETYVLSFPEENMGKPLVRPSPACIIQHNRNDLLEWLGLELPSYELNNLTHPLAQPIFSHPT